MSSIITATATTGLRRGRDLRAPTLPVLPGLQPLLPGLPRGGVIAVDGIAATSLLLALAAGASTAGAWCAAVGLGSLGLLAADELGVALDRLVLVPDPGAGWPAVVAALVDGLEVVVVQPPGRVHPTDARRLAARVRERGAVLLVAGPREPWPSRTLLTGERAGWTGPDTGYGRLLSRQVSVRLATPAGTRSVDLWLPGPQGEVAAVEPARPARARRRAAG